MGNLIIPKHTGEMSYIMTALEIYYTHRDWLTNEEFVKYQSNLLIKKEILKTILNDKTHYTKDAELLRYFGLVERQNPGDIRSSTRATELGIKFFEAWQSNSLKDCCEIIMRSLELVTFGRNNEGCGSDSDIEPPNICIIASIILDGISRAELAFMLDALHTKKMGFTTACLHIKLSRISKIKLPQYSVTTDQKYIQFLRNIEFLDKDNNLIKTSTYIQEKYFTRIRKLNIYNNKVSHPTIAHLDNISNTVYQNTQQIFYGCPGTGKSHAVKRQTQGKSVVRTTFHPDSDYSTFVGCYKPTTKQGPRYTSYGEKAVTIKDAGGKELVEDRIVYEFVDQAFLQAYIKAWKFWAEAVDGAMPKKQYLIIEEINRGNCAQIFGDLFQLLDRNDNGFSDYYIHADKDIQKHLAAAFEDLTITDALKEEINSQHQGEDIVTKVLSGEILLLPSNLYIWATMNTSDQSLFPIDSAFKRRWDWKYQPIVKGRDPEGNELNWQIEGDIQNYDWWSFIGKINEVIASTTNSEDKKLGFFFCKAKDGIISAETFVSKVIFYLWNDVFKNFGFDHTIFKDGDGSTLEFDKFYTSSPTGETIVDKAKVEQFLANLEVEATKETIEEVEEDEDVTTGTSDLSKYTINGSTESWGKNALAAKCVQKFVDLHPDMSAEEVLNTWKPLSNGVPHFIETEEQHNARTDKAKNRCERISCGRTHLYVEKNNYTEKNGKIEALITAINEREGEWGIRVDKVE